MSSLIESIKSTISENFGGIAQKAAPKGTEFSLEEVPDQSGKVAVITGGSEGIGFGCTHTLLSQNISKIFILSVTQEAIDNAITTLTEELGHERASRIKWLQCDMSNLQRVVDVSAEIQASTSRLDILINNAARGIMTYQLTDYGIDRHMAVSHIGHALLTSRLLPLLKQTSKETDSYVRISNQASNAHESSPKDTAFETIADLNQDLGPMAQYGRAKLAAILYSRYLARHLTSEFPKILINATHPGVVETKMSRDDIHEPYPVLGYAMSKGLQAFKKNQFEGALPTMFAATVTQKSGEYICPPAAVESGSELAQNEWLGERLMKLTQEIIAEKVGGEKIEP